MQSLINCPRCGTATDNLKRFDFPQVTFLVFAYSTGVDHVTACPSCLRGYLGRWGALSLLTANLLWPVVIFPLLISRLFGSFLPGHRIGKKSLLKKLASGVVGISLVLSAFVVFVCVIGMFGPSPQTFSGILIVSLVVMVFLGLIGAFVDL